MVRAAAAVLRAEHALQCLQLLARLVGPAPGSGRVPLGLFVNSTVTSTKIAMFQCPSDRDNPVHLPRPYNAILAARHPGELRRELGEHPVRPGPSDAELPRRDDPADAVPAHDDGVVRLGDRRAEQHGVPSEILQGSNNDLRGDVWTSNAGAGSFNTRFTPNSFIDFYQNPVPTLIGGPASGIANADILPAGFCIPESPGLPCLNVDTFAFSFAGARSLHPGGVNVLLGDGSVRFIKNTINGATWIALGSISSGEVISADSY